MAEDIFQRKITPEVPYTVDNDRPIEVYVPDASGTTAGIASFNIDDFVLSRSDNNKVSIIWPYAKDGKPGLTADIKIK